MTVYLLISLPIIPYIHRVGQNRMYTPYMTVYTVISLPMMPYVHREYMVVWSTLKYPVYIPVCQCGHVRVVSCQSVLVLMPLLVSCQCGHVRVFMSVSACAHATACVASVVMSGLCHVSQCLCSCHCLCHARLPSPSMTPAS